jgi:hypothetical protein
MVDNSPRGIRCRRPVATIRHPSGPLRGTLYAFTIVALTGALLAAAPFFRPLALPVGNRQLVIFAGDTQRMREAQWGFRFAYREVTATVVTPGPVSWLFAFCPRDRS